ncbi:MAG TPA: outer membrane homotrimeric porin [Humidesulfovibrio sp.]|uniref:outer membrane homotrimeric porin n=1 Tax=Humidesulfovibrio sp. TaxID=2910988 RepID=UPI002CB876EB|nr:outer membrane homotrimeric porin [Humidesulfovibrio sp.]HWR03952.1 outer membrane homotrimeric porin [Humidesulfovibrio sp.]
MSRSKLLVAAALTVLLMATGAQAAELTARGYWWMEAVSRQNWNFNKGQDNHFSIEEKLRTAFVFTANENLRGVLDTQIGTNNWGNGLYQVSSGRTPNATTGGGAYSAGEGNIMLRQGFIEYKWPNTLTNIKAGFQIITLPAAFGGGSPIFDDQAAAFVVSTPLTDAVSLTAGYVRPSDGNNFGSTASLNGTGTATDMVFASLPIKAGSMNITPFGMYMYSGHQSAGTNSNLNNVALLGLAGPNASSSEGVRGYWGGAAFTMAPTELPIKVMADFDYGKATYSNYFNNTKDGGRAGWMADLAIDYTGMSNMTPEAFFVYSSGETGRNTDRSNRMPVVGIPQNWTIGSFFFGERLELAGSMNNPAGYTLFTLGYWAGGISLKNMTFFDKLSHDFNLLYARGTNDPEYLRNSVNLNGVKYAGFLTTKDSLWEVDLNTRYKIYDELTAYLYLGYIKSNFDINTWGASAVTNAASIRTAKSSGDAAKVGLGLNYFF